MITAASLPFHLEHFIFLMLETQNLYFFSNDYQPLDKLHVWDNYSYVHNLYQIKPCAMPLFKQTLSGRVTYLKRKKLIAIKERSKSFSKLRHQNNRYSHYRQTIPQPLVMTFHPVESMTAGLIQKSRNIWSSMQHFWNVPLIVKIDLIHRISLMLR